jgi:hypothetical protein
MSDIKLGQPPAQDAKRDAIHTAIAPVVAAVGLKPGEHIGLLPDGRASNDAKPIGIVDPFLTKKVKPGERFWLCLYQQTVTGMRHVWRHPDFKEEEEIKEERQKPQMSAAEGWIRDFAEQVGLGYDELMEGAKNYIEKEEFLCFGGLLESVSVPEEFWDHYYQITGRRGSGGFFSCSC